MFARCVGFLASSLTSTRIRFKLVMMGVGERSLVNLADWIKLWQFCSSSREKVLIHSYCRPDLSASMRASRTRILACTIPGNIFSDHDILFAAKSKQKSFQFHFENQYWAHFLGRILPKRGNWFGSENLSLLEFCLDKFVPFVQICFFLLKIIPI